MGGSAREGFRGSWDEDKETSKRGNEAAQVQISRLYQILLGVGQPHGPRAGAHGREAV